LLCRYFRLCGCRLRAVGGFCGWFVFCHRKCVKVIKEIIVAVQIEVVCILIFEDVLLV
jgi:hypothetical protein